MRNNRYIYKTKRNFNFSIRLKFLKNTKRKLISKIVKSKRLTGLFKRKFNMRTTILRKRSLFFLFFESKKNKKRILKRNRKKKFYFNKNYRISNITMYNKVKKTFFENRKILKWFFKNKNLNRQNKLSKYSINFLNKNSKNIINTFEFKLNHILLKSHFFNNLNDADFFINSGFIFVNSKVVFKKDLIINVGDIIKLNDTHNYYFFYRKNLVKSIKMSKKIN